MPYSWRCCNRRALLRIAEFGLRRRERNRGAAAGFSGKRSLSENFIADNAPGGQATRTRTRNIAVEIFSQLTRVSGTKSYSPTPCRTKKVASVSPLLVTRCGRRGLTEFSLQNVEGVLDVRVIVPRHLLNGFSVISTMRNPGREAWHVNLVTS
jgi:hypothetical protein